jgi:hypothetical protein
MGKPFRHERTDKLAEVALNDSDASLARNRSAQTADSEAGSVGSNDAERDAAWAAFKVLTEAGWRSASTVGAKQDRDELHRR